MLVSFEISPIYTMVIFSIYRNIYSFYYITVLLSQKLITIIQDVKMS